MIGRNIARRIAAVAGALALACSAVAQDSSTAPAADSPAATPAAPSTTTSDSLNADMKLEDLVKQDVVVPALSQVVDTVDRQESTVGRSPAAVFVITQEMIQKSGARNVPEALRMAPGISVAKIDASTWAITARGFQGRFANKLLVQIDRRVVYSPTMYGGVFWDMQDLVLADVERIEVIRGPGATTWGSNAVNGVINIITKKSSDTQGALIQSGGGNQEKDFNTVRYGGKPSEDLSWRAWGQQFDRNRGWSTTNVPDSWRQQRGGFRTDWTPAKEDTVTVQGDIFNGYEGQQFDNTIPQPPFETVVDDVIHVSGGDILARHEHVWDEDTSWQCWAYYDRIRRNHTAFSMTQDTYDLDCQYQFSPGEFHKCIAGANYRLVHDNTSGGFSMNLIPPSYSTQWASVFASDTMTLYEDYLYFTLGCRLEYNSFGKFQPEPTARLLWLPSERQSCWMAVSRAVRNPTRFDTGLSVNLYSGVPNTFYNVLGQTTQLPEDVMAYEIGYRAAPTDNFSFDLAGYINAYENLQGFGDPGAPIFYPPGTYFNNPVPLFLLPVPFANNVRAVTYGFEATATWKVRSNWELFGSYSLFEANASSSEFFDVTVPQIEGGTPHNQMYVRSSWNLSDDLRWDLIGRYVDRVTSLAIPKYIEMDTQLSWQITRTMEARLVGQNLLNPQHLEYRDWQLGMRATEVRRGIYAMLSWTY